MPNTPLARIVRRFDPRLLFGAPAQKTALVINPPVYDVQYWAEWSQPYGLLRIAAFLGQLGYRRRELYDFMETGQDKCIVSKRRIGPEESFIDKTAPEPKAPPYRIEKGGEALDLWEYHFGQSWDAFNTWLDERGFDPQSLPDTTEVDPFSFSELACGATAQGKYAQRIRRVYVRVQSAG